MENVLAAKKKGLELIAITNHGPMTVEGNIHAPIEHFRELAHYVPKVIEGVAVLCGAEVSILDKKGKLDLPDKILERLDIVIASCHQDKLLFVPKNEKEHLETYTAIMNKPHIDILGHMCKRNTSWHIDQIIKLAIEKKKLIEINNATFTGDNAQRRDNSKLLIQKCLEHRAPIVVNSDAHFCTQVGEFTDIIAYLESINFPEELIVNRNKEMLLEFLLYKSHK